MHSIELMDEAIALAQRMGWKIRYECLGEVGGGACEIGRQKWIFIDLALHPLEQCEQVIEALKSDPLLHVVDVPGSLSAELGVRRAA